MATGNFFGVQRFSTTCPSTTTDAVLVTVTGTQVIRVIAMYVSGLGAGTAVTFNAQTGTTAGTAIAAPVLANSAAGPVVLPEFDPGWFETPSGKTLTCNTGAGATVAIHGCYVTVAP